MEELLLANLGSHKATQPLRQTVQGQEEGGLIKHHCIVLFIKSFKLFVFLCTVLSVGSVT